ncbi:uncharacterized protein LOC120644398 [Panicum virgatum]|uniref:DUF4220 domain-containing protein n=1 Tax=Panicum virgatum TaxID=38727 RepID=A0A8T0PKE8_PANVG|nr:uncharacterized protein LOC120644398 [Panicum virgatum]KAG2562070.1 hypothetical protein PVAP13_8KG144800 [Panicum virgatum]
MFDVWSAVRWWDDWQLRVLVLGSLCLQWFLLLAAPLRKYTIPRVIRTCIWLAFVSSDALAIYSLATLFNRHAKAATATSGGGYPPLPPGAAGSEQLKSNILEILWAPILLIHLGGQQELTAYTIEDNELWMRHTITLLSQVAVALYSFYKSWPAAGDWRLLSTAVLLFIIGVVSFSEKPWALSRAKINRLADVSSVIQGTKTRSEWRERLNQFFLFESVTRLFVQNKESFANKLRTSFSTRRGRGRGEDSGKPQVALKDGDKVFMILSDMSISAAADELKKNGRVSSVDEVFGSLGRDSFGELGVRPWLRGAFAFIYTRASVVFTLPYLLYHLLAVPALHIAALVLFATSDKQPYKRTDVKITYILLCLTAALDFFAVFIRQVLYLLMSNTKVPSLCETVPSYNLVDTVLRERKKDIGWMYKLARWLDLKMEYFSCKRDLGQLYRMVAGMVITDLGRMKGRDLASYRTFTVPPPDVEEIPIRTSSSSEGKSPAIYKDESRGEQERRAMPPRKRNWALSEELQQLCTEEMRKSLLGSFDRSVLLWHIATDLCFRKKNKARMEPGEESASSRTTPDQGVVKCCTIFGYTIRWCSRRSSPTRSDLQLRIECAQAISNYMVHLLNFNPEMLLTGSRKHLITEAMKEIDSSFVVKGDDSMLNLIDGEQLVDRLAKEASHHRSRKHLITEAMKEIDSSFVVKGDGSDSARKKTTLHIQDACRLANELLAIDYEKRWNLLYQVWLGMLCYSASMCRGYLHAKSLGEGGEFLSYAWLILSLKGAITLADKLQMPAETTEDAGDPESTEEEHQKKALGKLKGALRKKPGLS